MITDYKTLDLQSCDILLCSGNSKMSKRIQWFQDIQGYTPDECAISHVAGVYKTVDGRLQAQESTTLNKWADKAGVQMNDMEMWLPNYDGDVWVRKLDFDRTPEFKQSDREFWIKHRFDPYEHGIMGYAELVLCGLRLDRYVRKLFPNYQPLRTKSPHCTELVSMRLKLHKLIKFNVLHNRLPPAFWWQGIDTLFNCPIGKPIRIK